MRSGRTCGRGTGPLDRQNQECGSGCRDHIVKIVGALLEHSFDRLVADDVVRPADQEPGRRLGEPVAVDRIAGQLLQDKLGKRRVAVERADHVIAIRPRAWPWQVGLVPLALTEPDDIKPVPPPALAVLGRGQQLFDEHFKRPRVGLCGGDKGVDRLGSGRKARQVKRDAANQGRRIGRGCRGQAPDRQAGQYEGVDRCLDPFGRIGGMVRMPVPLGRRNRRIGRNDHQSGPARRGLNGSLA